MKIELKNFKHFASMSEETYCFTATLVINGTKCGTAKNQGFGGSTDIHSDLNDKSRELIKQAEEFCKTLPPYYISDFGEEPMNLEHFVDDLVHEAIKDKAKKQDEKRLIKKMEKAVLYGNDDIYYSLNYKIPLCDVIAKYPQTLKKHFAELTQEHKGKNYRVLNTNIPQGFFN